MKRLVSAMLVLAAPALLGAQVTVRGTAVDQTTRGPIVGASITVTGTTTMAVTNDSEKFTLTSADAIASITATRVGYSPKVVAVANMNEALRIELAVSTTELPGVQTVAASPAPSTAMGAELSVSCLAVSDPSGLLSMLRPWASYTYTSARYISFYSDNNNAATVNFSVKYAARVPRTMDSFGVDAASSTGLYPGGRTSSRAECR